MDYLFWAIIIILFIVSFLGLVYPVIPSVLFLVAGFVFYGFFFSFESLNWLFWLVQSLFIILLFGADYIANMVGVKKFGGSKAGVWGSTVGLLIGPFIIPVIGILVGPFLGAVIAELVVRRQTIKNALKIGFGSVIGFISSVFTKGLIQAIMLIYFFFII